MVHTFHKTQWFKRRATELNAWHEIDDLKKILDSAPQTGDVVPGGNGLRKVRIPLHGRGKRGGARVIYYYLADNNAIILIFMYAKNEMGDISPKLLDNLVGIKNEAVLQFGRKTK